MCGQDSQKASKSFGSFAFQLVVDPQAGNMGVLFPPFARSAFECIKSEAPDDFIGLTKVIGSLRPRKIISWLAWIKVSQLIFIFS